MKQALIIFFSFIFLLFVQACSNTTPTLPASKPAPITHPKSPAPITLDKTYFKNKLVTKVDNEKGVITISTVNGFHKKPRRKTQTWANNFITAFIDQKAGNISYQINSLVQYKDHDKHLYKEVSYNTGTEQKTEESSILKHDISCLGSAYSGCIHTEHTAFSIDSTLIENMAASYTDGSQNKWRYTLSPRKGPNYSAYLFIAEIAALVEVALEYQAD